MYCSSCDETQTKVSGNDPAPRCIDPCHMKVLLVKPYWLWGSPVEASPPMGLLYLSSALKKRFPGISTRLLDMRLVNDKSDCLSQTVESWKPDLVGFLCLTGDYSTLDRLTADAKQVRPGAHISCGGPYPTQCPEDFKNLVHVDSIIRGEGETSVCDLVAYLSGTESSVDLRVKGVGLRHPDGALMIPDHSPLIKNLDEIPFPDWGLIDIDLYSRSIQINAILRGRRYMPIVTSRGCPFSCIYCHAMFGRTVRMRSAQSVVDEIETLVKHHRVDEIQIYDDIFNMDRDRVFAICDLIIEKKLNIKLSFPNAIRGDMMDDEMIMKLKQAGAYMITFAIETASPRLQKLIGKNLDLPKTIRAIGFAESIGLITRGFFMIGFPTETLDEIKQTIRLARDLPLTTLSIFSVVPFKGTVLHNLAKKHTNERGKVRLMGPDPTYFSPRTYYSDATGINLRRHVFSAYVMFFTPWRVIRYFIRIPRKALYLRHIAGLLKTGFITRKNKLP